MTLTLTINVCRFYKSCSLIFRDITVSGQDVVAAIAVAMGAAAVAPPMPDVGLVTTTNARNCCHQGMTPGDESNATRGCHQEMSPMPPGDATRR